MLTTTTLRGETLTAGHAYYQNLPGARERLFCICGMRANVLILVPGARLDRCGPCYSRLVPFLDTECRFLFIGGRPEELYPPRYA